MPGLNGVDMAGTISKAKRSIGERSTERSIMEVSSSFQTGDEDRYKV